MASEKDIIVNLKVEGVEGFKTSIKSAEQATDSLESSIKRMEDAIKTIPEGSKEFKKMTTELEALKVVANSSGDAFENNRTALAAYKKEISGLATIMATLKAEGKQGTQVFKDIQTQFEATKKKAGELSDKIGDINAEIKSLGGDTRGIDNVVRGVTLVANGYQLAAGATAVFGKENKDLAQALIKINGIMAITQSAQQIGTELTREDSIVKQAGVQVTRLWNLALGESTGAIRLFRAALASIGIGLVIAAIYELYTNWDKLKTIIIGSTQSLEDFKKKQDELRQLNKQSFDDYEAEIEYLVNIKQLTQEQADLKLSIKRREAEDDLKKVYDENKKTLQEYEQAVKNVTFAKEDGLTMAEVEVVRSKQKYIPTQKELTAQREITKQAELDYMKAVNERVKAEEGAHVKTKKIKEEQKKELNLTEDTPTVPTGADMFPDEVQTRSKKYFDEIISRLERVIQNVEIGSDRWIVLNQQIEKTKALMDALSTSDSQMDANAKKSVDSITDKIQSGLESRVEANWKAFEEETKINDEREKATKDTSLRLLNDYTNGIFNIAGQAMQIQVQNELAQLDERRKKGLITEKQYQKESARIKNEAAQKQRDFEIAEAAAKIPLAALNAYISALQVPVIGLTLAPIMAGIAAGFATAQLALIASAPLPKFREGGSVAKRLGLINGKKHEQGGVPIEVEGGEYVVKSESVRKYGVKMLDNINAMKFNPVITHSKIGKRDNKLNENLVTISSYLKQGYKIDAQGNQILKEIRDNMNKKAVYV